MMALSKCVLDRVSERKNELKGRMYGLVEIMSRSVFARMQKRTSLYKDLVYQLVEQVFDMFKQELDSAFIDGYAHGRDWENQYISNDEDYDLDSEIDNDSLSISTFESQTSSSEQSLDDDADYDGEEYYSIMALMDGVDQCVLDRVEERKNNFKDRAYGLMEIMSRSVFARMQKRTSLYKDLLDQLVEQVFDKFTQELNDAWRDGCAHGHDEWNVYSDYDDSSKDQPEMNNLNSIGPLSLQQQQQPSPLHSIENSSLHTSPILSQLSSQHQNIIQHEEHISDSEFMTESDTISSTLFETSLQKSLRECQLDEEMDDGEYCEDNSDDGDEEVEEGVDMMNNDQNEEHYGYTQAPRNDSDLAVVNGQRDSEMSEDDSFSQFNEDLSQHSSTQPQQSPKSFQNVNKDDEYVSDSEIVTEPVPISNQSQPSSSQLVRKYKLDEAKLNERPVKSTRCEKVIDGGKLQTNSFNHSSILRKLLTSDQNEKQSEKYYQNTQTQYDRDVQIISNDEELSVVNGQMDGDGKNDEIGEEYDDNDDGDGVDQLNGLEHQSNIDVVDSQVIVPKKLQTGKLVCAQCHISFPTSSDLILHTQKYSVKKLIKCPWSNCYKAFAQTKDLQVHLESHNGQLTHVCHVRRHSTPNDTTQNEMTNLFGSSQQQHSLQLPQSIHKRREIENKVTLHTKRDTEEYDANETELNEDNQDKEDQFNRLEYRGNIDGAGVQGDKLLQNKATGRVAVPGKSPKRKHVCEHCDMTFEYRCHLDRHIRSHTGERPPKCHVCEHCGKGFESQAQLTCHIRTHTGEKPFKCPFENCLKAFTQKGDMHRHVNYHTGQHPHVCEHCDKGFRCQSDLTRHIRKHTGEKPFKCGWKDCDQTFTYKQSMEIHYKKHSNQVFDKSPPTVKHVCENCGKVFKYQCHLKLHLQKAH